MKRKRKKLKRFPSKLFAYLESIPANMKGKFHAFQGGPINFYKRGEKMNTEKGPNNEPTPPAGFEKRKLRKLDDKKLKANVKGFIDHAMRSGRIQFLDSTINGMIGAVAYSISEQDIQKYGLDGFVEGTVVTAEPGTIELSRVRVLR